MAGFQFSNAIMRCPFEFSFLYLPDTRSAVTVQNKEKGRRVRAKCEAEREAREEGETKRKWGGGYNDRRAGALRA